jgi:hypothetical protein
MCHDESEHAEQERQAAEESLKAAQKLPGGLEVHCCKRTARPNPGPSSSGAAFLQHPAEFVPKPDEG